MHYQLTPILCRPWTLSYLSTYSTPLHELYFASMGGDGRPTEAMSTVLARDFDSVMRWKDEFVAMGNAVAGGSGCVALVYLPPDRLLPARLQDVAWLDGSRRIVLDRVREKRLGEGV